MLEKLPQPEAEEAEKFSFKRVVSALKERFKKEPPTEKVERDPVADIKKEAENIFHKTFGQNKKLEGDGGEVLLEVIRKSFLEFAKNKTTATPDEVKNKANVGEHKKIGMITCNGKDVDFWLHVTRYPEGRVNVTVDVNKIEDVVFG